jgi:hypothetical protein
MPDEITTNLHTNGKEWQTADGKEYRGAYHKYITKEVYTGAVWNAKTSKKLTPYVEDTRDTTYIKLKTRLKTKYITPQVIPPTVTVQDRSAGFITRYFLKKINEQLIIEVNKLQYDAWKSQVIDPNVYQAIEIKWTITGNIEDTKSTRGINVPGVQSQNLAQIRFAEKKMLGIGTILTNPLQYYTDTDFKAPADINA